MQFERKLRLVHYYSVLKYIRSFAVGKYGTKFPKFALMLSSSAMNKQEPYILGIDYILD